MMHRAWWCLEQVPYCLSRSSVKCQSRRAHKIVDFDPNWAFADCNSSLNSPMATKWCTKLEVNIQDHTAQTSSICTQIGHFRTVAQVRIHWWLWNDAQSLKQNRIGALLFLKSSIKCPGHAGQNSSIFVPELSVLGLSLQFELTDGFEMMRKTWCSIEEVPYYFFQGHPSNFKVTLAEKNYDFNLIWIRFLGLSEL